jgi:hypothetical protein
MWIYLTSIFSSLTRGLSHLKSTVSNVKSTVSTRISHLRARYNKFMKLVNGYRDHGHPLYRAVYYSARLVYRRNQLDHYAATSSVKEKNYLFTKVVVGGAVHLILTRVKTGPKPILEYAYFDGVRKDHFFNLISGPNRDFGGNTEVLFLFAKEIRYKYLTQPEICIRSENVDTTHSDELEKKILSMTLSYE